MEKSYYPNYCGTINRIEVQESLAKSKILFPK
jgi:hypothetical protein